MATASEHQHNFLPCSWPFKEPDCTVAYTSDRVMAGEPIVLAFHDHDGEWQFLHGEVGESDECKIICMGCVYELDNTIGILADLPAGYMAYRDSPNAHWQSEPYSDDESVGV